MAEFKAELFEPGAQEKGSEKAAAAELQNQINEVLGIEPVEKKEEPVEQVEETEEKPEEKPVEEKPKEKPEEKKEEPVAKEEEVSEEETVEEDADVKSNKLIEEIERLTSILTGDAQQKVEEKPVEEAKEQKPKEQEAPESFAKEIFSQKVEIGNFVKPEMFKETFSDDDRTELNTVITSAVNESIKAVRQQALSDALKVLAPLMDYKIRGHLAAQEFWQRNDDLAGLVKERPKLKRYVELRSAQIQKEHPKFDINEVLSNTEKEVRDLFKDILPKYQSQEESNTTKKAPVFVKRPGTVKRVAPMKKADSNDQAGQISELLDFNH